MQHIVAMRSDAVDMVASSGKTAVTVWTSFVLHVFLEAIFGERFVFDVVGLVLFCGGVVINYL